MSRLTLHIRDMSFCDIAWQMTFIKKKTIVVKDKAPVDVLVAVFTEGPLADTIIYVPRLATKVSWAALQIEEGAFYARYCPGYSVASVASIPPPFEYISRKQFPVKKVDDSEREEAPAASETEEEERGNTQQVRCAPQQILCSLL